ncbi:MAG: squalene/phytoene synthase family protein [Acidobacteria bacterium]|nr:squalene/phytoene synthase family protein [Acidobacteriota bacterium]
MLDHLLQASSRTFALTIPLLGEPTRREVTVAYLLFRVADSLEDSTLWAREKKLLELEGLARFLERPSGAGASDLATRWVADPPLEHAGYVELLRDFPEVMRAASAMSPQAFSLVASHTARTCRAMAAFVAREEQGVLRLRDLADLKAYCYAVAGIVGEMLTELFLLTGGGVAGVAADLRRDAAAFGEALQLVNILKDTAADAVEGRHYLPDGLSRSQVFSHARLDLGIAAGYCGRLESVSADRGIVAFTALPILLARATLDRVEERGPGAKITRAEVTALVAALHEALARGAAARLFEIDPGRRPERGPNG